MWKRCVDCPALRSWAAARFGEECEQPRRVHARQPVPTNPGFGGGDPGPLSSVPYCLWKSRPGEFLGRVQADGACPTGVPLDVNPVCSAVQKVSNIQWVNLCPLHMGGVSGGLPLPGRDVMRGKPRSHFLLQADFGTCLREVIRVLLAPVGAPPPRQPVAEASSRLGGLCASPAGPGEGPVGGGAGLGHCGPRPLSGTTRRGAQPGTSTAAPWPSLPPLPSTRPDGLLSSLAGLCRLSQTNQSKKLLRTTWWRP